MNKTPRKRFQLHFLDEEGNHDGRTEQHHRDMCDVNNILKQHDKTGLISHVNTSVALYGDYTEVNEYQDSLNIVIRAEEAFSALPSDIRKRFENDPGQFFEFATDPKNGDELVKLGLAKITPESQAIINEQKAAKIAAEKASSEAQ
ncbi:MAG: internal scaffolding protein [Microviridae sp.]|nr:MAG: internal scaffolding protein [Microviridae sp.]